MHGGLGRITAQVVAHTLALGVQIGAVEGVRRNFQPQPATHHKALTLQCAHFVGVVGQQVKLPHAKLRRTPAAARQSRISVAKPSLWLASTVSSPASCSS